MNQRKICLGTNSQFGLPDTEQIALMHRVGFDATFADWSRDMDIDAFARAVKQNGMIFQSIHAPFKHIHLVWGEDEEAAAAAVRELQDCLADCARLEVPIMVAHAFKGFEEHCPNDRGIERLYRPVRDAERAGVQIAFENTEGIEYLDAVMDAFSGSRAVGFCWDTGHELCYNYGRDQLAKYGDRLLCTHLNDNLGISDPNGRIFWTDDLHLLPFDGVADWADIAARLQRANYEGILTFELNTLSKPNRHENDAYAAMPLEDYFTEVLKRARKVAAFLE